MCVRQREGRNILEVGDISAEREICLTLIHPILTTALFKLPARCQPKFMVLVAGRDDTQSEKRLIIMLAKSVSRWAASVMMAKLWAKYPPRERHQAERSIIDY